MRNDSIIQEFDQRYVEAYNTWNAFYPEAETDLKYFLGDQWNEKEKTQLFQEGRNAFVFNRVRRNINMITGYQRKHRLSSVVVPIENSDQKTADQLSQLLLYVMNYGDGYRTISDCFGGALKTGFNLMSTWLDYRDDPVNGDIKFGRDPYNGFIVDPYFTKLDFSDCGYIMRRKYLNPEQVISMLPGKEKEIWDLYHVGWERDDKFTWLPYQRQPNGQELMAYNEFFLQKWREVPMIVDMVTGEFMEFDVPKERQDLMLSLHENLKIVKRSKRYIERHIIVNDQVMKTDENPYGLDEYPFTPFVGLWEPESDLWELKMQSLIRCMRDPQKEANRRRSQMIDMLDSQVNSGWIANENSVINPRSLFQTSQGKVIWRREDAPPGAIEKIQPAQIPPSMFQLQELFDRDMMEIVGVNDASFGVSDNAQESGIMMMLRQGAALVNIQDVFDNLRFAQKSISQKALKLIQTWTPEKVKRIINEEPTQEFYDRDFTKYDVTVSEGMLTDTQKQMYFRQLVDLKQLGAPVTGEMLAQAAPIQGKTTFIRELAEMEKAQAQQAQQAQQVQEQLLDSQRQSAQAKAISDLALSKERFTRSVANLGLEDERASKAVQDRSDATLTRVKAIKELQSLDDDRLVKYLGIIRMMEEVNYQKESEIKHDNVNISARAEEGILPQQQQQQISPEQMAQQQQLQQGVSNETPGI
jgi:hypothetical protein